MSVNSVLKREGITVVEKLPILKTNIISNNISTKLCEAFPEHNFDKQDLFINLSRLNMYVAEMPYTSAMAKYVSQSQSIYFNKDLDFEDLDTVAIHECLHFIQESKSPSPKRMGLADMNKNDGSIAINEAAVQLMASEANNEKKDIVTYYGLTFSTTSPTYYTLECALVKQMAYFTGTYPLYHSAIYSNDIFKNTFIQKTNKRTYNIILKNLDKLVELEDILSDLTNELKYSSSSATKIKLINNAINARKAEIFNLFLKTQNIIMTNSFNMEFKNIRNMEELKDFKSRVYNYQYAIATNKDYTFYRDFFYYTMNKIQDKESYLEKHGYILTAGDKETALMLFEEKKGFFDYMRRFVRKFRKLSQVNNSEEFFQKENE